MTKTLLLVFIHGFKGSDNTFGDFPKHLKGLLSHALPKIDIRSVQYPQYETRGDLKTCVAKFKEWLQNKVIDLEVANRTPSPTVDPSVHVILCGHSMGGIVAAETLISIIRDEPVPAAASRPVNATTSRAHTPTGEAVLDDDEDERAASAPPNLGESRLFFPHVQGVLAFDTPYLGISPGVLAHGAEEHFNQASSAYKAFDTANKFFGGLSSPRSGSPGPAMNAATKGLPAAQNASNSGGWGKWGKYAMVGAAVAGAAGAAYLNRNQISAGLTWAGSHLEFVGCLARGAELQKRVEMVVELTQTHGVGFANFYGALSDKVTGKTKYAGAVLGEDRTFCVVPKSLSHSGSPTGSKRQNVTGGEERRPRPKRRKTQVAADSEASFSEGEQVRDYAEDETKSKGRWVKCVNSDASDELRSHTSMFAPQRNPDYYGMSQRARDEIAKWIDHAWYEDEVRATGETDPDESDDVAEGEA